MKILVVQNKMGIGDMIIYLPFIDAISKKFKVSIAVLKASNNLIDNTISIGERLFIERK